MVAANKVARSHLALWLLRAVRGGVMASRLLRGREQGGGSREIQNNIVG